MVAVKSVKLLP